MKKHYMAPKAEIVQLTLEGMVAASEMKIDDREFNEQLSDKQESIWDNDIWNEDK